MLELLKKGSGIHIKPENKGKFTDYCGGKVTSECIAKGKKSSNPVIRKRATFALNARKWKHLMGGNLILDDGKQLDRQRYKEWNQLSLGDKFKRRGSLGYKNALELKKNLIEQYRAKYRKLFGGNINFLLLGGFLLKVGNFLNSNTGKSIINGITGLALTYSLNKLVLAEGAAQKALNEADYYKTLLEITSKNLEELAQLYMNWVQAYQLGLTQDKPSDIVQSYIGNQLLNRKISNLKNDLNILNKTINSMISKLTSNNWLNTFGGLVNTGIGLLSNNTSIKE